MARERVLGIKGWPADDRPRERLLRLGAQALSDAELLAIVLRTGTRQRSALDVARDILSKGDALSDAGRLSIADLTSIAGIGRTKAAELLAAMELGRRVQASRGSEQLIIRTPDDVASRMAPILRDQQQEVFVVLMLDARNGLRAQVEISRGTLTASLVHPREVYKAAIEHLAAAIVVVHNHPSGNPEPSREDIDVTRQLSETGKIVGIPLHDHVIIAGGKFTSFAERGLL